ncbi:hypothetical protein A2276_07675 [candidate division WOR-1 bacterium RIFOXYA12_FULL_43_27]|uniref:Response regulatory domain-containing protein n=1 Tax=candidate division WOR-1 bacterium RIFOXYC2_FULL_46_14 TaxID=1802587 RepID=A0A1F4U7Q0_UNCSA|nr:MAG: hypothetical protein A2276_07675 [candidate division WOR-1 bacterium RIFOXYA12_FULL_43_27]OGC20478.1 MAG: hypothetical protein A2292_05500 [candidate division WOR-1 bacterium RIFOXYB2_FULL_46_45]OGC31785.1 MAG: hypothetical protein A2232_05950 [candidate division WOR-1 bacterium RIFOXYA2_FULL_46_56]OGC40323.1 MAG: hypothetical protein A2438_03520 [candidate division WOR-1 bacterium RIFOXYC2_FULL_46_14]
MKNLLIVDDDKEMVKELVSVFEMEGYGVFFAFNGLSALERYRENSYDLVLLDIKMPVLDGREVFKAIKSKNPRQKIIIVTGSLGRVENFKQDPVLDQADGCFEKPFVVEQLLSRIRELI